MRKDWERFSAAGVDIVAVGQGSVARTKEFREQMDLPFPLLADPRRLAYRAYGLLKMNWRREASLGRIASTVRASLAHGMAVSKDQDMAQLGGVFVVGTDGRIVFAHRSDRVDDVPKHAALLAAARTIQGAPATE